MSQPRYVIDEAGKRVAVLLDIEEYERMQEAFKASQSVHPAVWALLTAPENEEPYTDEDRQAVEQGRASIRAGRVYTHEEIKRRHLG